MADQAHIRNFSIIAHIDHGKSTLADRILELTHTVDPRSMRAQVLDSMDLERERGITIKAQAVRVFYESPHDGQTYQLQLIDTPGHVDFTYEVSRSLAACEGALLVVDASQGVEAQTVANTYLAVESGLELIPCLNKVDLPGAEPERVAEEVADLLGEPAEQVRRISAKTGEGITDVLDELIARVPPPDGDPDAPPRALIFDSEFDQYRGVIAYIRVVDGTFTKGEAIRAMQAGTEAEIDDIGFFTPADDPGQGAARRRGGLPHHRHQGRERAPRRRHADDQARRRHRAAARLPRGQADGVLRPVPDRLRRLSRPARRAGEAHPQRRRPELGARDLRGAGLRLPLRLPRPAAHGHRARAPGARVRPRAADHDAQRGVRGHAHRRHACCRSTAPTTSPTRRASPRSASRSSAPRSSRPKEFVGQIMELCQERRGEHAGMHYLSAERVQLTYDLPLAEIVLDFFDQLKSRTRGYASLDYDLIGLRESDLVKLDILLAGDPIDALSMLVHRSKAQSAGRTLTEKLREKIPRQQYDVPIQAAIGSRIVARETIKAYRKDVIAKCYGGDITRKRKLLEAQKKGKQRMKQVGRIEVPQEAFLAVLELGDKG